MGVNPRYKQTEVGEIPDDWGIASLGELTDEKRPISYGIVQTGPAISNGVRCIRVVDIHDGKVNQAELITTSTSISDSYKRTVLKAGDLVMPLRGKVGEVALIDEALEGCNLTRGVALIGLRSGLSASFFKQAISSCATRGRLVLAMNGSALQEIPIATLRAFKLAYPPTVAEQEAIAEALGDADALIESLEQLLAKKRQVKQGAMQELLTGQTRLPGFSGEWIRTRLGDICEISMGRTPSRLNPANWGAGHKWLSIADLKSKVVSEPKEEITPHAASEMQVVRMGTLLMSFKLSIGRLCFAGCDLYTNEAICSFGNPKAHAEFLYYLLGRTDFSLYGKQAVKGYTLNKESLNAVGILLPAIEEQVAIASALCDIDSEIDVLEAELTKARHIKQGMTQELLTGRIRLV